MFITIEGTEGSGKTSQARLLARALEAYGSVTLTREPGGTEAGERIRALLLAGQTTALDPMSQLLLLSAARAQLVRQVLLPALARGDTLICVRYADSTRAYQGAGEGIPERDIEAAIALATGGLEPDLTILLDVETAVGLQRRLQARDEGVIGPQEGWNRFDARDVEFHERVRRAYRQVAAKHPRRVVTVDASRPFDMVAEELKRAVLSRLIPE